MFVLVIKVTLGEKWKSPARAKQTDQDSQAAACDRKSADVALQIKATAEI